MHNKTLAEFETLTKNAKILEQESAGVKVLLLPDKRIVKLFRRKHLISSQIWAPRAWRFSRNARILKERGIPTITVEEHFKISQMQRQAVIYERLEGKTLRDTIKNKDEAEVTPAIAKLGAFIAQVHEAGVLFRSLHLNNVLVREDGELALIDIADMGFRWWGALTLHQRIRNFHHMDRYDCDRIVLAANHDDSFIQHYLKNSSLQKKYHPAIEKGFNEIFEKYRT